MLRLITKLHQTGTKHEVTIADLQIKESKLLSEGTKLGVLDQINKLLQSASSVPSMVEEPYDNKYESIEVVIEELTRLRNIEVGSSLTYAIVKTVHESGRIDLAISISPPPEDS